MHKRKPRPGAPGPSDLERLLQAERRLAAVLEAARDEGEQLVRAAASAVEARIATVDAEIERTRAETRRRREADLRSAVHQIEQEAHREVARFAAMPAERRRALQAHVILRVAQDEGTD